MKQIVCILFLVLTFSILQAQTNNGTIQGNIQNLKKELLSGITVQLANTGMGTVTDEDGFFIIKNVSPGNYTLVISGIGYKFLKENVIVKSKEITTVDLQLNEVVEELDQVIVPGGSGKFVEDISTSGTRTSLRLIETPQSIQVVTHDIIKDQQAQNLTDVSKNLTGVISNSTYSSYTMRGFTNYYPNSFITFDGFVGNMYQWSQMVQLYNIDRVEMISGPASALFSVGTPGGVMNMVTKRPKEKPLYTFNVTYGSWNLIDVAADLAGPLSKNKKLLYRLNIGYNHANSFRPYQFTENIVIAPSLTYTFNSKTNINLDFVNVKNRARFGYDRGGLVFMNADSTYNFKGALDKFINNSPNDHSKSNAANVTLLFNHELSSRLKLTYMGRIIRSAFENAEHYSNWPQTSYNTHADSLDRRYDIWNYRPYNIQNSLFTTATLQSAMLSHTLVTGIDYQRYGATQNKYIDDVANTISVINPDYSKDDFSSYPLPDKYQNDRQDIRQTGLYFQDLISVGQKLKVLLAGRYEDYSYLSKPVSIENWSQDNDSSSVRVFLPRAGVVYSFTNNHSVYGSYSQSFKPQYSNNRGAGGPFPPQKGKQIELGYKGLYFKGRLMSTVALYSIAYVNILKPDPGDPSGLKQIAVPGMTSKGAEVTFQGNVDQFNIIAGYAYNRVIFSDDSPLGPKGGRYDNAPGHIANLWVKYNFAEKSKLKGLTLSAGGKYVGNRLGMASNPHFILPAYFLLDAAVNYNAGKFNISVNGFNLLNTKYVIGGWGTDLLVPVGMPVNWKIGLGYTIK